MFGNRNPRHVVAGSKRDQRLAVPGEQGIKQCPPRWVGESPKHCLHNQQNRKPNGFLSTSALPMDAVGVHPYRVTINQRLQQGCDLWICLIL
jgi:hypothetical protein